MAHAGEQQLIGQCLEALNRLPGLRAQLHVDGADTRLELSGAFGRAVWPVQVVTRLNRDGLAFLAQQPPADGRVLLCGPLGSRQAEQLRQLGLAFVDAAGNAFLQHPPFYLDIRGHKPAAPAPRPGRAFTTAGLKLIYTLLQDPALLTADYRRLAAAAGIALGNVGSILGALAEQNYLQLQGRQQRMFTRPEALLYRWQLGYVEHLRARLLLQRCRPQGRLTDLPQALRGLPAGTTVLLGGELGARCLLGEPASATGASLHLEERQALRLMLQLGLTPDPEGPVTLLRLFGQHNRWNGWQPDTAPLADALLLHGELAASGQGNTALAEQLQRQLLLPRLAGTAG